MMLFFLFFIFLKRTLLKNYKYNISSNKVQLKYHVIANKGLETKANVMRRGLTQKRKKHTSFLVCFSHGTSLFTVLDYMLKYWEQRTRLFSVRMEQ